VFPIRKLRELSPTNRARKVALILLDFEERLRRTAAEAVKEVDAAYLLELLEALHPEDPAYPGGTAGATAIREARGVVLEALRGGPTAQAVLRPLNALRHGLLGALGAEPAEWDFLDPDTGGLDASARSPFPIGAYLEDIRSPYNVGSMFRTAEAFGASRMVLSPSTPRPDHPRASRTSRRAESVLPWSVADLPALKGSPGIFALELGGIPLDRFDFPAAGTVLVGSEELGLSPEALRLAETGAGRVSIPLSGAKRSLNVAVAFGILMQRWHARLSR
jgi:RNA methyltransferase, TrmH family